MARYHVVEGNEAAAEPVRSGKPKTSTYKKISMKLRYTPQTHNKSHRLRESRSHKSGPKSALLLVNVARPVEFGQTRPGLKQGRRGEAGEEKDGPDAGTEGGPSFFPLPRPMSPLGTSLGLLRRRWGRRCASYTRLLFLFVSLGLEDGEGPRCRLLPSRKHFKEGKACAPCRQVDNRPTGCPLPSKAALRSRVRRVQACRHYSGRAVRDEAK